jgi:inhibitor of cysteine peptidase
MKRLLPLLGACVLVGFAFAVTLAPSPLASSAERVTVGPAANGSRRVLERGDVLVVRLPSNPSTGYGWAVCSGAGRVLRAAGRAYVPPQTGLVGAPGTAVLRFRAAAAGKSVLRLTYRRSWEQSAPPARTFVLRVTIAKASP